MTLAKSRLSTWGSETSGVYQRTKLGPWLFLALIYDLEVVGNDWNAELWKYVNGTTTSEIVVKWKPKKLNADKVVEW